MERFKQNEKGQNLDLFPASGLFFCLRPKPMKQGRYILAELVKTGQPLRHTRPGSAVPTTFLPPLLFPSKRDFGVSSHSLSVDGSTHRRKL